LLDYGAVDVSVGNREPHIENTRRLRETSKKTKILILEGAVIRNAHISGRAPEVRQIRNKPVGERDVSECTKLRLLLIAEINDHRRSDLQSNRVDRGGHKGWNWAWYKRTPANNLGTLGIGAWCRRM
jgi:hypothetical protein